MKFTTLIAVKLLRPKVKIPNFEGKSNAYEPQKTVCIVKIFVASKRPTLQIDPIIKRTSGA